MMPKLNDFGLNHGKMEIIKDVDTHIKLRCHCGRTFVVPKKGTDHNEHYVIVSGERRGKCPGCGCIHNGLNNEPDPDDGAIQSDSEKASVRAKESFAKAQLRFFTLSLKSGEADSVNGMPAATFTLAALGPGTSIEEFTLRIIQEHRGLLRDGFTIEQVDEDQYDKLSIDVDRSNGKMKASVFGALLSDFLDRR